MNVSFHFLKKYTFQQALAINISQIRFRKRRWAPIAKSKLYVVRQPQDFPEKDELQKMQNKYRTEMKSIRVMFIEERTSQKYATTESEEVQNKWQDEFNLLKNINNSWNKKVSVLRESRQAEEDKIRDEMILKNIVELEGQEKIRLLENKKLVMEEIEKCKSYINKNQLDSEIEKALNSQMDFNFAIDIYGNHYYNVSTHSKNMKIDKLENVTTVTV